MNARGFCLSLITFLALACFLGCASSEPEKPLAPPADPASLSTLAILPFDNNSMTDPERYEPLCQGLAAMLTTDIKQRTNVLRLIERSQIAKILNEMELSQAGVITDATAVKVGNLLGAENLVFGSFMVLNGDVRMDARLVKVETGEVLLAECVRGGRNRFISLQSKLADQIAHAMNVCLAPRPAADISGDMDAAVWFSKGVNALDKGDAIKAKEYFDTCAKIDPAYASHISALMKESDPR
jgi:TolB-like protein